MVAIYQGDRGGRRKRRKLLFQTLSAGLFSAERGEQGLRRPVPRPPVRDGTRKPLLPLPRLGDLALQGRPLIFYLSSCLRQPRKRLLHGGLHQLSIESLDHGVQDGLVQHRLREMEIVRADGWASLPVVSAPVELAPPTAVMPAHGDDGPATRDTAGESTQEIREGWRELREGLGLTHGPMPWDKDTRAPVERHVRGLPEVIRDDPGPRQLHVDQVSGRPRLLYLRAPSVRLLGAIPEAPAAVKLIVEHLADGGRRPAVCPAAGRGDPFGIELLGDPGDPPARGRQLEDPVDDSALRRIDDPPRGRPVRPAVHSGHGGAHVVVAVDLASGDVAAPRQAPQGIVRPLLPPLPLHLGGEAGEREEDLLGGRVERALPVVEVVEEPHPGIEELLDDVGRLDLLPPEPALLAHDEHLKGRTGPEHIQEPRQPRPLPELGATDPIVHEDGLLPDDPAVSHRIGSGMFDLPGHALQPPHLAAMVPWEGAADEYRDSSRHGGILSNRFMERWYPRQVEAVQHGNPKGPWDPWMNERSTGPKELSERELSANRCDNLANARAREMDDDWYRGRSPDWSKVTVPFLSPANWAGFGLHPRGNFAAFTEAASREKWLEGHPGRHEEWFYLPYGMQLQKRFFDYYLKGEQNGWDKEPRVWLNLRRPFTESVVLRKEDAWPLQGTRWTRLYLDAGAGALDWKAPGKEGRASFKALGESLKWLSLPLEQETEITGPMALKVPISSSSLDADLFVTVQAFSPDGREVEFQGTLDPHTPLAQGWLRASHRKLDPARSKPWQPYHTHDDKQPLNPGWVYDVDVEIWPTCIILPKGFRLSAPIYATC